MQIVTYTLALTAVFATHAGCFEVLWSEYRGVDFPLSSVTKFKCTEEGRFPHPSLCGGYVECIRHSETGTFKRRFGNCHGGIFSPIKKACVMTTEEQCKRSQRSARSISTDRRLNNLCREIGEGFICADCKTSVNCVDGIAYTETCSSGDTCVVINAFGGSVCYPTPSENCTCNAANEFFLDAYNPEMFFFCNDIQTEPDMYKCPGDMTFDIQEKQCKNQNNLPQCTASGIFPYYENCSSYYVCVDTQDGWVQKSYECDIGTMFNEDTGICEDPCSWDQGQFNCAEEGRFPDPLSCRNYYECIISEGGSFRQIHQECPTAYEWDSTRKVCTKESSSTCAPVTVSKCHIPDGFCPDDPSSVSPHTNELSEDIATLESRKLGIEEEIKELMLFIDSLVQMEVSISGLVEFFDHVSTYVPGREARSSRLEIPFVLDDTGRLTVSPYCGIQNEIVVFPGNIIETVMNDVLISLTDRLDVIPCLKEVLVKVIDGISDGSITFVASLIPTIRGQLTHGRQEIFSKIDELEISLAQLQEEKKHIEDQLKNLLSTHLDNLFGGLDTNPIIRNSEISVRPTVYTMVQYPYGNQQRQPGKNLNRGNRRA